MSEGELMMVDGRACGWELCLTHTVRFHLHRIEFADPSTLSKDPKS